MASPSRSRSRARSGKTSVEMASATTMPRKTSITRSSAKVQCEPPLCTSITMQIVTPASRELLRRPSNPQTITAASTARIKFHGSVPTSVKKKPRSAPISVPKMRLREAEMVAPKFDCSTMMALIAPQ